MPPKNSRHSPYYTNARPGSKEGKGKVHRRRRAGSSGGYDEPANKPGFDAGNAAFCARLVRPVARLVAPGSQAGRGDDDAGRLVEWLLFDHVLRTDVYCRQQSVRILRETVLAHAHALVDGALVDKALDDALRRAPRPGSAAEPVRAMLAAMYGRLPADKTGGWTDEAVELARAGIANAVRARMSAMATDGATVKSMSAYVGSLGGVPAIEVHGCLVAAMASNRMAAVANLVVDSMPGPILPHEHGLVIGFVESRFFAKTNAVHMAAREICLAMSGRADAAGVQRVKTAMVGSIGGFGISLVMDNWKAMMAGHLVRNFFPGNESMAAPIERLLASELAAFFPRLAINKKRLEEIANGAIYAYARGSRQGKDKAVASFMADVGRVVTVTEDTDEAPREEAGADDDVIDDWMRYLAGLLPVVADRLEIGRIKAVVADAIFEAASASTVVGGGDVCADAIRRHFGRAFGMEGVPPTNFGLRYKLAGLTDERSACRLVSSSMLAVDGVVPRWPTGRRNDEIEMDEAPAPDRQEVVVDDRRRRHHLPSPGIL